MTGASLQTAALGSHKVIPGPGPHPDVMDHLSSPRSSDSRSSDRSERLERLERLDLVHRGIPFGAAARSARDAPAGARQAGVDDVQVLKPVHDATLRLMRGGDITQLSYRAPVPTAEGGHDRGDVVLGGAGRGAAPAGR